MAVYWWREHWSSAQEIKTDNPLDIQHRRATLSFIFWPPGESKWSRHTLSSLFLVSTKSKGIDSEAAKRFTVSKGNSQLCQSAVWCWAGTWRLTLQLFHARKLKKKKRKRRVYFSYTQIFSADSLTTPPQTPLSSPDSVMIVREAHDLITFWGNWHPVSTWATRLFCRAEQTNEGRTSSCRERLQ